MSVSVSLFNAARDNHTALMEHGLKIVPAYLGRRAEAVNDLHGEDNTNLLKLTGLEKGIGLLPDEYIPSLGELYFIFTHLADLNDMIIDNGGTPIEPYWFWSSTMRDEKNAWFLDFSSGMSSFAPVRLDAAKIRPLKRIL